MSMPGIGNTPGSRSLLARNTALNLLGEVVPLAVGVMAIPPIIAGLGNARFGILSLLWVLLWYFSIFDLGLGRAVTKLVSECLGKNETGRIPRIFWTAVAAQAAISCAALLLFILLVPLLAGMLPAVPAELKRETEQSLYLLALFIPVIMVTSSCKGMLEAAQRFDVINAIKIPSNLSVFLLSWIGISLGFGLPGIIFLLLLSRALVLAAYFHYDFRVYPGLRDDLSVGASTLRSLLSFGGWSTVTTLASPVLVYAERFIIIYLLSAAALAYYAAPAEIVLRLSIIPLSISTALFPAFSHGGAADRARVAALFSRPLKYILCVVAPLTITLIAFGEELLLLWLGKDYAREGLLAAQILAAGVFFNALAYVPFTAVQGLGRPDLKARLDLFLVPLFLALSVLMVKPWGLAGAALARLVITLLDLGVLMRMAGVTTGLSLKEMLPPAFFRGVFLALALAAAMAAAKFLAAPAWLVLLAAGLSLAAYAAVFFAAVMDALDRSVLRGLIAGDGAAVHPARPKSPPDATAR